MLVGHRRVFPKASQVRGRELDSSRMGALFGLRLTFRRYLHRPRRYERSAWARGRPPAWLEGWLQSRSRSSLLPLDGGSRILGKLSIRSQDGQAEFLSRGDEDPIKRIIVNVRQFCRSECQKGIDRDFFNAMLFDPPLNEFLRRNRQRESFTLHQKTDFQRGHRREV